MKKIILFLSIFAAFAVGGITLASSASAASCSAAFQTPPVYWDGQFAYSAYLNTCSGVNGVEFASENSVPYGGNYTGLYDFTHANWHFISSGGGTSLGVFSQYTTLYHVPFFGAGCNGTTSLVKAYFGWRIRNSNGSTWGSWHNSFSPNQYIC